MAGTRVAKSGKRRMISWIAEHDQLLNNSRPLHYVVEPYDVGPHGQLLRYHQSYC